MRSGRRSPNDDAGAHPRYLRRGRRPSSSGFGEAFASTGAERTWVLEHRSAAKTEQKPEIGGRPGPLRYRRCPKATRAQMQGAYPPCREVRLPSWQHPLVSENRRKLLQIVVCESGGSIRIHKRPVVWKFPDRVWKDVKTGRTHIAHHRRIETLSSSPWGTKDFKHLGHPVPA